MLIGQSQLIIFYFLILHRFFQINSFDVTLMATSISSQTDSRDNGNMQRSNLYTIVRFHLLFHPWLDHCDNKSSSKDFTCLIPWCVKEKDELEARTKVEKLQSVKAIFVSPMTNIKIYGITQSKVKVDVSVRHAHPTLRRPFHLPPSGMDLEWRWNGSP